MKREQAIEQGHTGIEATCTGNGPGPDKEFSPMFDEIRPGAIARAWIAPGAKVWLIEQDNCSMIKVRTQDDAFTGWMYAECLQLRK